MSFLYLVYRSTYSVIREQPFAAVYRHDVRRRAMVNLVAREHIPYHKVPNFPMRLQVNKCAVNLYASHSTNKPRCLKRDIYVYTVSFSAEGMGVRVSV